MQNYFVLSFVFTWFALIFFEKNKNALSLIKEIISGLLLTLCIGWIMASITNCVIKRVDIELMTVGYCISGLVIWMVSLLRKKMQRFLFDVVDFISLCFITVLYLLFIYRFFGNGLEIINWSTDIHNHYGMARTIIDTQRVEGMSFNPLFNAMCMIVFSANDSIDVYNGFVIAECINNYMNVLVFFLILSEYIKGKWSILTRTIVTSIYFMGWPYFCFINAGFCYHTMGITLCAFFIYVMFRYLENGDRLSLKYYLIGLIIILYSISSCYMLFTPLMSIIVVAFIALLVKRKIVQLSAKKCIIGFAILLILGIAVFSAAYWGYFKGDSSKIFEYLALVGWIYADLLSDYIFLVPVIIVQIISQIKKKKLDIICIGWMITLIYLVLTYSLRCLGIMSLYYYCKPFFLLWLLSWVIFAKGIETLKENNKLVGIIYLVPIVISLLISELGIKNVNCASPFPIVSQSINHMKNETDTRFIRNMRNTIKYCESSDINMEGMVSVNGTITLAVNLLTGTDVYSIELEDIMELEGTLNTLKEKYRYVLVNIDTDLYRVNIEYLNKYKLLHGNEMVYIYDLKSDN